jgi:hypothetical protein
VGIKRFYINLREFLVLVGLVYGSNSYSQNHWDVAIKPGAAIGIVVPGMSTTGYFHTTKSHLMPFPSFGAEVRCERNERKAGYFGGIVFLPVTSTYGVNSKNIKPNTDYSASFGGGEYAVQIYFGAEKRITNIHNKINKNYFSVLGGIGFNTYLNQQRPGDPETQINEYAETYSGKIIEGTSFGAGHYVSFAPSFFGGIQYNIRNTKGKVVVMIQLMCNYGLTKLYDHKISYLLDGVMTTEYLSERGGNIQLNVKIPLFGFKKNKR